MAHYWIFKTDNKSGRTISICNGNHDTEAECRAHWRAYSFGLCDGFQECLGEVRGSFQLGEHELSLRIINGEKDVEYFMLLNDEGKNFHYELCSRIMTRFEFHACDAENESLRSRLQENKRSARLIYAMIANSENGHYFTGADLSFVKEQLKSIIQ